MHAVTTSHRRCRRALVVVSLLSWTCGSSTAFSTPTISSSSSPSSSLPSPSSPTSYGSPSYLNNNHINRRSGGFYATKKNSPLEDEPWKNDKSYWDQLQAASKDPQQFEKFIEESMKKKKEQQANNNSSSTTTIAQSSTEEELPKRKKGKYVPIEEWDAQRSKKENMTQEERLQWECQRGGNQLRQNDILMHNLRSF